MAKCIVSFKDPDFLSQLENYGLKKKAISKIRNKSEFGEYFVLQLVVDEESGDITTAKFLKAGA